MINKTKKNYNLDDIRKEIDILDKKIISLLGTRFEYVKAVAEFKKNEKDVKADDRVKITYTEERRNWAIENKLNPDFVENLYRQMINYFISEELKIYKQSELNLELNFETEKKFEIKIFSDGACSGNPGISGIGCVIFDKNNKEISRENKFIGETTNNFAEYSAILLALDNIEELKKDNFFKIGIDKIKFEFFADSELMVNQLNGKYKISNLELQKLALKFKNKIAELGIKNYTIKHIMRENNKIADSLAVLAKSKNIIKIRAK